MRCAAWARRAEVDPVGTAGRARGWLLVEWPRPWPRAVDDVPELAPVRAALAGSDVRLQLVVPGDAGGSGGSRRTRRVVLHRAAGPGGWFAGCERHEVEVDAGDVVDAGVALATGGAGTPAPGVDVLVCAHGSRDRCCGSLGTALALGPGTGAGVRVLRTSHLGGHRFAPTGLVLPDATAWAFLDADALGRIVTRSGPLDDLLPRYRGCGALGPPAVQALDRAAFAEVGWGWLDHARRAAAAGPGRVALEARSPSGEVVTWEAAVAEGRALPVPDCGRDVNTGPPPKTETEVVVQDVTRRSRA